MFFSLLKRVARNTLSLGDTAAQTKAVICEPSLPAEQKVAEACAAQNMTALVTWGTQKQRQRLTDAISIFDANGRQAVLALFGRIAENFPELGEQEIDALLSALTVATAQSPRSVARLAGHVIAAPREEGCNAGARYLTPPRQYVAKVLEQAAQVPLACLYMCGRCHDITRIAELSEAEKAQKKPLSAFVYAMQ